MIESLRLITKDAIGMTHAHIKSMCPAYRPTCKSEVLMCRKTNMTVRTYSTPGMCFTLCVVKPNDRVYGGNHALDSEPEKERDESNVPCSKHSFRKGERDQDACKEVCDWGKDRIHIYHYDLVNVVVNVVQAVCWPLL